MPRFRLHCHNCGTGADVELGELEERSLRTQGHLNRYCNRCSGFSHWELREAAPSPAGLGVAEPDRVRGRVLAIDDDENILKLLSKILTGERVALDVASSGREALGLLAREEYDVILSDIRMPELNGKELFGFLEQHMPEYKSRVIFLTGDTANPETMEFLDQAGCAYLTKPLDIPTLLELLRGLLPQA